MLSGSGPLLSERVSSNRSGRAWSRHALDQVAGVAGLHEARLGCLPERQHEPASRIKGDNFGAADGGVGTVYGSQKGSGGAGHRHCAPVKS